jgi:uncharacterized protein (DUF2147 family)
MRKTSLSIIALLAVATPVQAAAPITGRWVTQDKDGVVEIYACGDSICGKLAKFLNPPPGGNAQKDVNNSNPALRSRPLLGINLLRGFKAAGNEWKGSIYDPRRGKTFRSVVYKGKSGNLVVKGCIGPICQTQTWTPAS